jgi:alpha-beta hydrolase superfamily lysophospholipase
MVVIHGLGEHSGRYADFAKYFTDRNIGVIAFDLRGHGKSEGNRGDCASYEILLDDVSAFLSRMVGANNHSPVRTDSVPPPVFLYGHSLGGNLALNWALLPLRDGIITGVIVTAPWLRLVNEPRDAKPDADGLMPNTITPERLFRDPSLIESYRNDPLIHNRISPTLYLGAKRAGSFALRHAAEFPLPLLLIHGTGDEVTDCNASREFAEKVGEKCQSVFLEGGLHGLHQEDSARWVCEKINHFIEIQAPPQAVQS